MFKTAANFIFLIALLFSTTVFAQNVGKVKATISDMPEQIQAGQTAKVTVTITNTGNTTWTSENAYAHELGPFEINKEWQGEWKLEPGQSKEVYYKVTAPDKSGSYKMRIIIYNGDKKIAYRTKKVEVVSLTGK